MSEEKLRILKMLEEGKIKAEQAEKLLAAVGESYVEEDTEIIKKGNARWIKIRVYEGDLQKPKVKVSVPLKLAKIALKLGTHFSSFIPKQARDDMEKSGVDPAIFDDMDKFEELLDGLSEEGPFKLVDVDDEEGGSKVQITVE